MSNARTELASSESIARTYERAPGVEVIAFSSFAFTDGRELLRLRAWYESLV